VRAIPADVTRERAMTLIGTVPHARLAVVDRSGRVVGMLRQIDLHLKPEAVPASLLVQPARLTRDMRIRAALTAVMESAAKIGVVQDAAGRPIGLVTPKDLVELSDL
jgi:CBS domain containing-hemolysin-like protein